MKPLRISAYSRLFWTLLSMCLLLSGCQEMAKSAKERNLKKRENMTESLHSLSWIVPKFLDQPPTTTIPCDDAQLPRKWHRTSRHCKRIATIEESAFRTMVGTSDVYSQDHLWMRQVAFKTVPIDDQDEGPFFERSVQAIQEGIIGIFTRSTAESPDEYHGMLLIVDVGARALRCALPVQQDISNIRNPPKWRQGFVENQKSSRGYEDRFFSNVSKDMKTITEHLCVK